MVHLRNGKYGLIEVKLGGDKLIEEGARNLVTLESKIDTEDEHTVVVGQLPVVKTLLALLLCRHKLGHVYTERVDEVGLFGLAQPGDIVTLSPACSSFDFFKNFEERGNTFRVIVESLK